MDETCTGDLVLAQPGLRDEFAEFRGSVYGNSHVGTQKVVIERRRTPAPQATEPEETPRTSYLSYVRAQVDSLWISGPVEIVEIRPGVNGFSGA